MSERDLWHYNLRREVHWKDAYAFVERHARHFLESEPTGKNWTTTELVEFLYPWGVEPNDPEEHHVRQRIFKALAALATRGLSDCASRGTPRQLGQLDAKGTPEVKTIRPWLWHSPTSPNPESVAKPLAEREVHVVTWRLHNTDKTGRCILFSEIEMLQLWGILMRLPVSCERKTMTLGEALKL